MIAVLAVLSDIATNADRAALQWCSEQVGLGAFFERFSGFEFFPFRRRVHPPTHQRVTQTVGHLSCKSQKIGNLS